MGSSPPSTDPADTPDISARKLLRQGGGPMAGAFSVEAELSSVAFLGLPLSSSGSELRVPPELPFPTIPSVFLFLLRLKLPLSNIFSQFGSRVQ